MYLWELIAQRLLAEGWLVRHRREGTSVEPSFTVVIHRAGSSHRASGPTLTEAFAEAARRARGPGQPSRASSMGVGAPHVPIPAAPATR